MATVDIAPKIRCDNCGLTVEKEVQGAHSSRSFHKPRTWGSIKAEGGRVIKQAYGHGKDRLDFTDLCQNCADAAMEAAASALAEARGEGAA